MKEVDYAKLSGQYASFLVAVGGVSITVLTLVLNLNCAQTTLEAEPNNPRVFLIAALSAATVSCFIGAHMMAETAAFFTRCEKKPREEGLHEIPFGKRLFALATSNLFIAVTLVLFSIVLLPTATGDGKLAASLKWFFGVVFLSVVSGALLWLFLSATARLDLGKDGPYAIAIALTAGLWVAIFCYAFKELRPQLTFIFIVGTTAVSLIYFAIIFKFKNVIRIFNFKFEISNVKFKISKVAKVDDACTETTWCTKEKVHFELFEMVVFGSAITMSYASLVVAYLRILQSS